MYFQFGATRIDINIARRTQLLTEVRNHLRAQKGFLLATINLDHIVKLQQDPQFLQAYAQQDMVVADGNPIVWLSRLARRPVELMPGSDMIRPLAELAATEGRSIALLGSSPEALRDACTWFEREIPGIKVVRAISPPMGFDPDSEAAAALLTDIAQSGAGLCFLALSAPKQERLAARAKELAPQTGFASIGAGLDFLGGHQVRAPLWMRKLALEWLWRAANSPRRLAGRYVSCALVLPKLTLNALSLRSKTPPTYTQ